MLGSADCESSVTTFWNASMTSEDITLISGNFLLNGYMSWSQQWTVLVERVLWKGLELPQVIFYSLAHPCCAKIGLLIKPLAGMDKMYQIHLCTYKDLCSLTDRQGIWWYQHPQNSNRVLTHTHSPPKKRGKESSHAPHTNIYTFANIKFC